MADSKSKSGQETQKKSARAPIIILMTGALIESGIVGLGLWWMMSGGGHPSAIVRATITGISAMIAAIFVLIVASNKDSVC